MKTTGYIVVANGVPMHLHKGTLWFGSYATLFTNRRDARAAITRTVNYTYNNDLWLNPYWQADHYIVCLKGDK